MKKGFTLIELLAVIIILGVIMLIAIPSVTKYISESRKDAYVATARRYIESTRTKVNEGDLGIYDTDATYYIPISCIKIENGGGKSSYGDFKQAYVIVSYDGDGYDYYWASTDTAKMGISHTDEKKLKENLITVMNHNIQVRFHTFKTKKLK